MNSDFVDEASTLTDCFKQRASRSDRKFAVHRDVAGRAGAVASRGFLKAKNLLAQNWPLVALVVGAIVTVVLALLSLRDGPLPYERRGGLLGPAEIAFLRSLQLAVREDWLIFSMVRLSDILKVRSKSRKSQSWTSRLQGKHLDFVLCDEETLEVKLAIELDDDSQPRTPRDKFVYLALTSAGLPLLRVRVQERYETMALRKDIEDAIGILRKKKRA